MKNKLIIVCVCILTSLVVMARPHRSHRHARSHHHCNASFITGAAVGGLISAITTRAITTPVVVSQPTRVLVPGHYVAHNVNGVIVYDWIPERYELR